MNCEEELTPTPKLDRAVIVQRIDNIARELAELRRMVETALPSETSGSITSELLGCLGSEPLNEYDYSAEWGRFGADEGAP